ncbi:response regulator [Flagellimonas marinaquae]
MMNKHKVCIIDDDSIFVYGTKILLNYNKHFGDDILVFEDGQEALDAFKNFVKSGEKFPDFIFLDLNMPVMDGWQFLDELEKLNLQNYPNTFLISSHFDAPLRAKAKTYEQVTELVEKPLSDTILQELLLRFSS